MRASFNAAFDLASRELDIPVRDLMEADLPRALAEVAAGKQPSGAAGEVHKEMLLRHGAVVRHSLRWPLSMLAVSSRASYTVGSAAAGGNLVETTTRGDLGIDALRPLTMLGRLGADIIFADGPGNIAVPSIATAGSSGATAEGSAGTEGEATFGKATLTPHQLIGYVNFTRLVNLQAGTSRRLLDLDLLRTAATLLDSEAITGSGSSPHILGLLNASSLGAVSGTTLGLAGLISAQSDVVTANGVQDPTRVGWAAATNVPALLAARFEDATTKAKRLWQGNLAAGQLLGAPAYASGIAPASTLLFGDFSQVAIVLWTDDIVIEVNPFSNNFAQGGWSARVVVMADLLVRHGASFAAVTSIT